MSLVPGAGGEYGCCCARDGLCPVRIAIRDAFGQASCGECIGMIIGGLSRIEVIPAIPRSRKHQRYEGNNDKMCTLEQSEIGYMAPQVSLRRFRVHY